MVWVRKMFRGGKVWAEVDEEGQLVAEHGVVKIRYRPEDERTYSARVSDVEEIDETKVETSKPKAASAKAPRPKRVKAKRPKSGSSKDVLIVYTDGACFGNPGPAGVGALLEWNGKVKELSKYIGEATNNIAELSAIREALLAVRRRDVPVRVHTDSAYAIGVLSGVWKVRENKQLVESIQSLMQSFPDLELCKVRGHAGDPRNERVDELARNSINQRHEG